MQFNLALMCHYEIKYMEIKYVRKGIFFVKVLLWGGGTRWDELMIHLQATSNSPHFFPTSDPLIQNLIIIQVYKIHTCPGIRYCAPPRTNREVGSVYRH